MVVLLPGMMTRWRVERYRITGVDQYELYCRFLRQGLEVVEVGDVRQPKDGDFYTDASAGPPKPLDLHPIFRGQPLRRRDPRRHAERRPTRA